MLKLKGKAVLLVPLAIIIIVSLNLYITWISIEDDVVDNYVVDMAGRQRMLSKKLFNEFLLNQFGFNFNIKDSTNLFIEQSLALEMGGNISKFLHAEGEILIPPAPTPNISGLLASQRKIFHDFIDLAYRLPNLRQFEGSHQEPYSQIVALNERLTDLSNEIVLNYDRYYHRSLERSIRLRSLLSFLTILMGLALIYIFYHKDKITRELELAKKTMIDALQMKSNFFANVSHEIRNPLNVIIGIPDILESTKLTSEQRKFNEMLKYTSHHLLTLINDILDFSKIESGNTRFNIESFDLEEFLNSLIEFNSFKAKEKNISIKCIWDEKIDPHVKGDSHRLRQVLDNLMGNSIKFTDYGHVDLVVKRTSLVDDVQTIEFKITDTGIGISESDLPKIFNAFVQAEGDPIRKGGGTGLGLAIAKQLVELMGGKISVKSHLGVGTEFTFSIKMESAHTAKKKEENSKVISSNEIFLNRKLSLLIADDSLDNLVILKSLLEQDGRFLITTVNDGNEALDLFKAQKFDIILLDMQMPRLDGTQTALAMQVWEEKEGLPHTPVIVLTAGTLSATPSGFDDFALKPVDKENLIEIILRNLNSIQNLSREQTFESLTL